MYLRSLFMIGALVSTMTLTGCMSSPTVQNGDTIKVDYVGKLEDGTVFDTSIEEIAKKAGTGVYNPMRPYEPLEFTVGQGRVVKGFDQGVLDMYVGQQKTITIKPEDGYGMRSEDRIISVPKNQLSGSEALKVGDMLTDMNAGRQFPIIAISGDNLIVDTNDKLAGKTMIFELTLREIK